jgi:hypothetical protein
MEKEMGTSLVTLSRRKEAVAPPVKGGHHLPEVRTKPHGPQHPVHIGQAHPVLGMIKVKIQQETPPLPLPHEFSCRPQGENILYRESNPGPAVIPTGGGGESCGRRLDIPMGQQTYRANKVKLILLMTIDKKNKKIN